MRTRSGMLWTSLATLALLAALAPTAAAQEESAAAAESPAAAAGVELTLAHSYQDTQPQHACGAQVIADAVAERGTGLTDRDLRREPARRRRRPDRLGRRRRHRHGHPGRVRAERGLCADERRRRRLRLRRQPTTAIASSPTPRRRHSRRAFLDATGVRILGAWSAGARSSRPTRPSARPEDLAGPAHALPAVAAVPDERRGHGREPGRGRLRGALPGPPAGHGRRAGEPDQQHRGHQPPGGPGRHQPVEPPAELEPA